MVRMPSCVDVAEQHLLLGEHRASSMVCTPSCVQGLSSTCYTGSTGHPLWCVCLCVSMWLSSSCYRGGAGQPSWRMCLCLPTRVCSLQQFYTKNALLESPLFFRCHRASIAACPSCLRCWLSSWLWDRAQQDCASLTDMAFQICAQQARPSLADIAF